MITTAKTAKKAFRNFWLFLWNSMLIGEYGSIKAMDLQEKQTFRRICYSKVTIAILGILILLVARGTYGIYQKEKDTTAQRDMIQQQLATLEAREGVISGDVAALQTNAGLEKALRQKFGVAASGESVVVIVNASTTTATSTPPTPGFFQKVWNGVKGIF